VTESFPICDNLGVKLKYYSEHLPFVRNLQLSVGKLQLLAPGPIVEQDP